MNILYVEDNASDGALLTRSLARSAPQTKIEWAKTLAGARESLAQSSPGHPVYDIVLTDMDLPDGDGLTILALLRERNISIPVVVITGAGCEETAVNALRSGASDYLVRGTNYLKNLPAILESVQNRHRATERELAESAKEWRTTFNAIKDPVMLLDRDFKIIRANRATASFFGIPIKGVPGNHCFTLMHGTEGPAGTCPLAKMIATGTHQEEEFYSGEKGIWLSVSVDPIVDGRGEITGVVHIARDITQRKQAEEAIRKSEEKYRNIFENAMEGIYQTSPQGRFISANPSLARMHGFDSPDELMKSINDIGHQLYRNPEDHDRYMKTLREEGVARMHEVEVFKKDGSTVWVSLSARGVKDEAGRTCYYEGTLTDITARKTAEISLRNVLMELESKNRDLEAAYKAQKESQKTIFQQEKMASIGQLAAGVAHEINNPMGFIISNLNSLKTYMQKIPEFIGVQSEAALELLHAGPSQGASILERLTDARRRLKIDYLLEDLQSLIGESLDGADRVKRIVQDLKRFSRADDGEYAPSDINKTIESTLNIVWNELKYKATVKKEYGDVPAVRCNAGQLSQVFMNILVNASHAIQESGTIAVKTWHDDVNVYVSISDTGTGIPKDHLDRIFEPFFTTKDVGKGTGLGLSIVYDIMKKHNGQIGVKSEVGKGSTFTLTIPAEGVRNE